VVAGSGAKVQPVTKRHYPEFRKLLLAERERLVQELTTLGERLQQVEEVGLVEASNEDDYGDVAAETFEREKGFALESSVQGMLRMVEEALRKLDAGTYGTCERCGGPIDVERLRALPFASLCIRCKAEQEREAGSGNGWRT
jgi:DnaK suppressor protein